MITPTLLTAITFADGLLAGLFIGSSLVEHAAAQLSATHWIAYKQAKEAVFGPVMPIAFMAGLIATIIAAIVAPAHVAPAMAVVLMAIVLAITVTIHLPLNRLFQTWTPADYPTTWDAGRRRWRGWNLLRTGLMVVAYGLVLIR